MKWTSQHDILLGREMLHLELWKFKAGSREKGNCLDKIVENLNGIEEPVFNVSQKSVRDRIKILERDFRTKKREEERASGIAPVHREIDDIMEDYLENRDEEEAKQQGEGEKEKARAEKEKGEDMRNKAMERLAETKRRSGEDQPKKKRRKASADTLDFLREASERENEIKKEELEIRRKQEENAEAAQQLQQQQHQQQQQQFQMLMQMCLQNQQALLELMKK